MNRLVIVALALLALAACTTPAETPAPEPAPAPAPAPAPEPAPAPRVFFVSPANGATVTSPVKVVMGVEGMTVHAAGELIPGTGHHHIIVDGPAEPAGTIVPADATHIHFGQGQTEGELTLAPGPHTLRLQFADGMHASYGEEMGAHIDVVVVATP